jgi:hypothetical protein
MFAPCRVVGDALTPDGKSHYPPMASTSPKDSASAAMGDQVRPVSGVARRMSRLGNRPKLEDASRVDAWRDGPVAGAVSQKALEVLVPRRALAREVHLFD